LQRFSKHVSAATNTQAKEEEQQQLHDDGRVGQNI
jgi:hypothetical protein